MEDFRLSKEQVLARFERRSAIKRQRLDEKQRRLDERERQLQEERHQLEQERQRFFDNYKADQKLLNELWDESSDVDGDKPEPQLEVVQSAPMSQRQNPHSANGSSRRSVNDKVLAIVEDWPDDSIITQSAVTPRYLSKYHAQRTDSLVSAISNALSQHAKGEDGVLDLIEKGSGSRPAKYRKRQEKAHNMGP